MSSLFPLVAFDVMELAWANELLGQWQHQMGPCERPMNSASAHGLFHDRRPVAVAITATLIRPTVGGGFAGLSRDNTIELARLCAERRDLNRVVLRLWREFVFPTTGRAVAISYQDAAIHSGNLYRFDGWERSPQKSRSGNDTRSGRRGRVKWVWRWPVEQASAQAVAA